MVAVVGEMPAADKLRPSTAPLSTAAAADQETMCEQRQHVKVDLQYWSTCRSRRVRGLPPTMSLSLSRLAGPEAGLVLPATCPARRPADSTRQARAVQGWVGFGELLG